MTRALTILIVVASLAALPAATARATLVEVLPSAAAVGVGGAVSVALAISGLGDGAPPSLSTFDLDLGFDPTVLAFTSASFGDPALGDQLDLLGLGSQTVAAPGVGSVNVFELSLDSADDLNALQAGAFALATLAFNAIGVGSSALTLAVNVLGDTNGLALEADLTESSVTVTPGAGGSVPAPATALLLGVALLLIALRRRTRSRATGVRLRLSK